MSFDENAVVIIEKEKKEPDPIDETIEHLKKAVSIGDWVAVKKRLSDLGDDFSEPAFKQLVTSLQSATPPSIEGLDPLY